MGTTRLSGGRMFSSTRRLRTRLPIQAMISCSSGQQQQLECDVLIGHGAEAKGMVANDDRRRPRLLGPTTIDETHRGGTGFDHAVAVALDST